MIQSETWFEHLARIQEKSVQQKVSYSGVMEFVSMKAREKGIPIVGKFELTPLCNFDCKMCYVHLDAEHLNNQAILMVDTWKELMHQAWKAGMLSAILTGGECLTYPGFDELFLYLHSMGCEVSVLTNGLLLDGKRIQFFKKHIPAVVQVTLYGCNDDVYEKVTGKRMFSVVENNIKRAIEAGIPISISITPNKYMGEDIIETIRIARKLSKSVVVNYCLNAPREETGRSGQKDELELELFIKALKYLNELNGRENVEVDEAKLPPYGGQSHETSECGLICGGGRSSFAIDWKGTMMPCVDFTRICAYPLKDGFLNAWYKVNKEANNWPRVPECEGCAYADVCNRCATNMYQFAEPGKIPIGMCERTRELVRNGLAHIPDCE
jgi:radical SAM protein with 4Fe4S-binding SPASM domain